MGRLFCATNYKQIIHPASIKTTLDGSKPAKAPYLPAVLVADEVDDIGAARSENGFLLLRMAHRRLIVMLPLVSA
jgi:hypothetical protein